jgi:hypothetical protein
MHNPVFSPRVLSPFRAALRPGFAREDGARMALPPGGKGRPHADGTIEAVRQLIEESTLTYHQIAARTGAWKRPLFAPRSMLTVPTPRATAHNKHRLLSQRLFALADRYVRELEEASGADLDKLAQALELARMAKLATMSRTRRRTEAMVWGEPMRPIAELCAAGVDLYRAPREAVDDFLSHRTKPREEDKPPRSRGRGNHRYLTEKQRHRRMMEGE